MKDYAEVEEERSRRFRGAVLPHLGDAYTLAHYLMRNSVDAEDAVQECFLRALRHFDGYRGPAVKPWLLAILRNVCYAELAQRGKHETPADLSECAHATAEPVWQAQQATPESILLRREDDSTIRRLIVALPTPFREIIVLRELNELSYREIADVAGVPVGTVMSRLARARAMLLATLKDMNATIQERQPMSNGTTWMPTREGQRRLEA